MLLTTACADATAPLTLLSWGAANEPIELRFARPLDPLSLSASSLTLRDAEGRTVDWEAELDPDGRRLLLRALLPVDASGGVSVPQELRLEGFPSPRGLRWRDGGVLGEGLRLGLPLRPELISRRERAPRLRRVAGLVPEQAEGLRLARGAPLELVVDGVLDPRSLRPEAVPIHPVRGELSLRPVMCVLRAVVVGEQTRLGLSWVGEEATWELRTRDLRLSDLDGRVLEPAVVIALIRES